MSLMYFFLILFFVSLLGIIFMVSRKFRALLNGASPEAETAHFDAPSFDQVQSKLSMLAHRIGYFLLVETIRVYVRIVDFLKKEWSDAKIKIAKLRNKEHRDDAPREPNRFLKTVAEYKRKLGRIKQEVREEENLN